MPTKYQRYFMKNYDDRGSINQKISVILVSKLTEPLFSVLFRRRNKNFNLLKIIEGCVRRKSLAQKELFDAFSCAAKNICLRYSANEGEAEEMISDGFLKIFNNIEKYDIKQPFEAWFRTIMINTAIDYFRKNHSRINFTDLEYAHELVSNDKELDLLSTEEIMAFIQKLSPVYRTIFSLFAVDGYSYAEISQMLGITEGGVRANMYKARTNLQKWIRDYLARQ